MILNTNLSGANLIGVNLSPDNLHKAIQANADFCYTKGIAYTCLRASKASGLEDDAAEWSAYIETQRVYNVANVTAPSYDNNGSTLQISLLGGKPYTNIQAYRSQTFDYGNESFDLSL